MIFEACNELVNNFTKNGINADTNVMERLPKANKNIAINVLGGFNNSTIDDSRTKTDLEAMFFVYGPNKNEMFKFADYICGYLSDYSSDKISMISCQEPQPVEISCQKCEFQLRSTITINK